MGLTTLDPVKYRRLVSHAMPKRIESNEEFDRLVATLEKLDRVIQPTAEEKALGELLAVLIEEYDSRVDLPEVGVSGPEMLAYLMEENGLKAADLGDVMPRQRVSEILAGKRRISIDQAKKLGERFRVGPDLFL